MLRHSNAPLCLVAVAALAIAACGNDDLVGNESDGAITCRTSFDCPPGRECLPGGVCGQPSSRPDNPGGPRSDADTPYLAGTWSVEYRLDWSEYMGPLADLGRPIDVVDQILAGNGGGLGIPIAGSVVEGWIDQYIPLWVRDLVSILNSLVQFFQDVRMTGVMSVAHSQGDYNQLQVTEQWQWGYLSVIDQCPLGTSDINYPDCALLAVPLNSVVGDFGSIAATPQPYAGRLVNEGSGRWSVQFEDRLVDIQIGRFLKYVLDQLTLIATNRQYPELAIALSSVVDCSSFSQNFAVFVCNTFSLCNAEGTLIAACGEAVELAAEELEDQLLQVAVEWQAMSFDHSADLTWDRTNGAGRTMGTAQAPGTIENGQFELGFDVPLAGTWRAWR